MSLKAVYIVSMVREDLSWLPKICIYYNYRLATSIPSEYNMMRLKDLKIWTSNMNIVFKRLSLREKSVNRIGEDPILHF